MFGIHNEYYFYQLLEGDKRRQLQNRFNAFKIASALDIGCGDGRALLGLHYVFGASVLRGCERSSEHGALRTSLGNELCQAPRTIIEARLNISEVHGDKRTSAEREASISDLMKEVRYGCDAVQFSSSGTYDAIICSQVLHYFEDENSVRHILEMIPASMHTSSLVYVSVKDNFMPERRNVIRGEDLLRCCHEYRHYLGLQHITGHVCVEGTTHIFTNL